MHMPMPLHVKRAKQHGTRMQLKQNQQSKEERRAGYSNFGERIPSDNRVLLVEFVLNEIFGSSNKIFKRVTLLKASNLRGVKNRYIAQKITKTTKVPGKDEGFTCYFKVSFIHLYQQEYNKILQRITLTRQHIKNNLRHMYRGEVEWSPK